MAIFRYIAAKECREAGCSLQGKRVSQHAGFCEECHQALAPIRGWSIPRLALAVLIPCVVVLAGLSLAWYLTHRPQPLNEARRGRLAAWAHAAAADQVVTREESAALSRIVQEERLKPLEANAYVAGVQQHLEESRHAVERGTRLAAERKYEEARREYLHAVENDPDNATAWVNLGLANAACGREGEALDQYAKALRLEPRNWLAHYNLGLLWARRGDRDQALHHLEAAVASLPAAASPQRRSMLDDLRVSVASTPLHGDPRLAAFMARLGGH